MTSIGTYPIPEVADLANYSGRPAGSYTAWAPEALAQSTLLFVLITELQVPPDKIADPVKANLALNAICEMADDIYLKQQYVPLMAKPVQSETIGSYTYNKGLGAFRETPAFLKAQIGHYTGLIWWDLAVREFGGVLRTESGAISVFDRSADIELDDTGRIVFLGPADKDTMITPFDINSPEWSPGKSVF